MLIPDHYALTVGRPCCGDQYHIIPCHGMYSSMIFPDGQCIMKIIQMFFENQNTPVDTQYYVLGNNHSHFLNDSCMWIITGIIWTHQLNKSNGGCCCCQGLFFHNSSGLIILIKFGAYNNVRILINSFWIWIYLL